MKLGLGVSTLADLPPVGGVKCLRCQGNGVITADVEWVECLIKR